MCNCRKRQKKLDFNAIPGENCSRTDEPPLPSFPNDNEEEDAASPNDMFIESQENVIPCSQFRPCRPLQQLEIG